MACWTKCPAGLQHSARHFEPLSVIFPVNDWQISVVILVFLVGHFMCIEPCWTKCPAMSRIPAGHQQKSAGHVRHVRHISPSRNTVICLIRAPGALARSYNNLGTKLTFLAFQCWFRIENRMNIKETMAILVISSSVVFLQT